MAFAHPRLGYHHPQQAENKQAAYFDEDDSAVLDPAILDAEIMQSPNSAQYRKDSFANSNGVLSPADSHGWDHQYHGGLPVDATSAGASNPYHEENNAFVRQGAPHPHPHPHQAAYGHPPQGPSWGYEQGSGNCTPGNGIEFMAPPPAFETQQYHQQRAEGAHASFSHPHQAPPPPPFHGPHGEPNFIPAPQVQTPMSPHSHQDWMGMVQQEMESRPMPKRVRGNSPSPSMVEFARRDGIRKKNGRIDIPQERNIHTIDELIDQTTDEIVLKELKQQKRLLRNREAALASRQRKKKHTEDLEVKEKSYTTQISMLEKDVSDLALDRQRREEERQMLFGRLADTQRHIESLHEDIRNLKIQHNEETSSLRRKVNILTEQLAAAESAAPAMSAAPSSTGFTDFNAEMEALNMGPHDWDDFFVVDGLQHDPPDDFGFNSRPEPLKQSPVLEKRPSSSTVVPSPSKKSVDTAADQPFATGLLFMLLLCGAFVASKPPSSRPSGLPQMPPEVQAAAPTVLNNLLADAGSSHPNAMTRTMHHVDREPQASGMPHAAPRSGGRLDQMHHRLTSPTKQQEIDQAFSLTTAQYASITNMNYPGYDGHSGASHHDAPPRPRRNLAEALANLQQEYQQHPKAEVYTRSLLWDQVPTDVVKQFREMVRDNEEIEARQKQRSSHGYKVEA